MSWNTFLGAAIPTADAAGALLDELRKAAASGRLPAGGFASEHELVRFADRHAGAGELWQRYRRWLADTRRAAA